MRNSNMTPKVHFAKKSVAAAPVFAAPPPRPTSKPPNADGGELYGVSDIVPHANDSGSDDGDSIISTYQNTNATNDGTVTTIMPPQLPQEAPDELKVLVPTSTYDPDDNGSGGGGTLYRNAKISNCIGTVHPIVPSIVVPTGTYIRGLPSVSGPVAIVRNSSETMYRNVHTIPTCEVCDDDAATTFCSNCTKNQLLCDRCHATVHRSAKKQGHKPIPAKEYLAGDGGSAAAASSRGSDIYNEPLPPVPGV